MAYVPVSKDILKIKEKFFLGFTRRQLISLIIAGIFLIKVYFSLKIYFGIDALYIGSIIAIPILIFGFYEDDGVHFEEKLKNLIYFYSNRKVKVYKTVTFYEKIKTKELIDRVLKNNKRR